MGTPVDYLEQYRRVNDYTKPGIDEIRQGASNLSSGDLSGIMSILGGGWNAGTGFVGANIANMTPDFIATQGGVYGADTGRDKMARDIALLLQLAPMAESPIAAPNQAAPKLSIIDDGRPTQHLVHKTGMDVQYQGSPNRWQASDPNYAYRITGQEQINDMINSGLVRSKPPGSWAKGGRTGVTHWSQGRDSLVYNWDALPDSYILKAPSKGLHERSGPLNINELEGVYTVRNGKPVNVLPEIKGRNIELAKRGSK